MPVELDARLVLRTGDGDGLIGGRFDALALRSGDGHLDVTARRGSALAEPWSIESGEGRIALRIPSDLRATLDARTGDGPLTIDLPVSVQGNIRRHRLRGDLNGGGPPLLLRSTDGGLRVSALD